MCGICGFISKQNISRAQLKAMNDTMYHRGPNDSGEEIFQIKNGYALGLAQRRLAVIDLSILGHQPMHSENGRVSVVFNGEIYNFPELKEELSDYPFQSNCDTEVIIAAYLKWGIDCISKLNGMFAIAVYDRETEELFLIRDRIGKKPLYYWLEEGNIVFASELKPIMKCPGFSFPLKKEVMTRYMTQQYVNAPDTIFEQVYKLEPGAILKFHGGNHKVWKYWDIKEVYQRQKGQETASYGEAKEKLKGLLKDAVARRMIADVPLGTFLSGGYDSSLVTAMAQELSKQPVKTFSIGFQEEKYNEAGYAREVSEYLGTDHTELYIGEPELFRMIESIPKYFDEPFADSSQIPTMLVSELARKDVTVALSGDGGDEFFCGYNMYELLRQAQKLDLLGGMVNTLGKLPPFKQMNLLAHLPYKVRTIAGNRDGQTKTQLGSENYSGVAEKMLLNPGLSAKYPIEMKYQEHNWQERRMLLDMDTYLPGDILCKVDRASMKYSLETRCPILDTKVVEYAYSLPHEYKYKNGNKKRILKDIVYDYIPKELLERPKVGFSVPLDQWLRGPLKEKLQEVSQERFLREQNIFDGTYTNQFINRYFERGDKGAGSGENYSRMVWAFYMFQMWYQTYCK